MLLPMICRACLRLWDADRVVHRTACPYCGGALAPRA
jgi:DNA-directed RNA polymerase subunit RPC12/RpoP